MKIRFPLFTWTFVMCALTAAMATGAWASKSSQNFIREATIGNRFEISSSRLALQNSQNGDVQQFARQMVDDHTQTGDRLKAIIAASGGELKEPNVSLDQEHQNMLDALGKLSGAAFDREYIREQVKAHDDAVALFNTYAKRGDNADLKTFAAETLPTLQEHRQYANRLKASF